MSLVKRKKLESKKKGKTNKQFLWLFAFWTNDYRQSPGERLNIEYKQLWKSVQRVNRKSRIILGECWDNGQLVQTMEEGVGQQQRTIYQMVASNFSFNIN